MEPLITRPLFHSKPRLSIMVFFENFNQFLSKVARSPSKCSIVYLYLLVSASPNWYSNMTHSNRLDYQDSPIQWHPNPMYSGGLDDMDPRSIDYGLTDLPPPIPTVVLNPSGSVQQRSISRCLALSLRLFM